MKMGSRAPNESVKSRKSLSVLCNDILGRMKACYEATSTGHLANGSADTLSEARPLLHQISCQLLNAPVSSEETDHTLDQTLETLRESFYKQAYKDSSEALRCCYTDTSIIKACSLLLRESVHNCDSSNNNSFSHTDEAIRVLDMGLIMAGGAGSGRAEWIALLLKAMEPIFYPTPAEPERAAKRQKMDITEDARDSYPVSDVFVPRLRHPVKRVPAPDIEEFMDHMNAVAGAQPLIISNSMDDWPAITTRSWSRPSYLLSKTLGGRRLVPIEIGRSYTDDDWTQKIITLKEYMDTYLLDKFPPSTDDSTKREGVILDPIEPEDITASPTGYLAQHNLFHQIPSLRNDILTPDYCYTDPPPPSPTSLLCDSHSQKPKLDSPLLNAWFGPAETISPLHCDPYHNILCQVVGRKYIRLYSPSQTLNLYPRPYDEVLKVEMDNTSEVDVGVMEGWDGTDGEKEEALKMWPRWREAEFVECVLEEGEALYIPVGWWHYVRSLSVSFSVSFWWN